MSVIGHVPQEDLSLYAMQLLDEKEHAEMQRHLSACAECRDSLALAAGDLAVFALTAELHAPPTVVRERLLKQIAREKKVVAFKPPTASATQSAVPPTPKPAAVHTPQALPLPVPAAPAPSDAVAPAEDAPEKKRGVLVRFLPYLGWAAAAAMLFITVTERARRVEMQNTLDQQNGQVVRLTAQADHAQQLLDALSDQGAMHVSLSKTGAARVPMGRATYVPQRGALVFMASNMPALPPHKTYEMWIIPADGHSPVPAGTFSADAKGNATLVLPDIPKNVPAKAFGITIENEGGSQTPTLPIIMSGS